MADTRQTRTYGGNNPMHRQTAAWDGHRSVRLAEDDIGLATTAYSYKLSYDELTEAAERIALLWNLHLDVSMEELRRRSPAPQPNVAADAPRLTSGERLMLEWLSREDSSALGECESGDLAHIEQMGLAVITPAEGKHRHYSRVSLTDAGRAALASTEGSAC